MVIHLSSFGSLLFEHVKTRQYVERNIHDYQTTQENCASPWDRTGRSTSGMSQNEWCAAPCLTFWNGGLFRKCGLTRCKRGLVENCCRRVEHVQVEAIFLDLEPQSEHF